MRTDEKEDIMRVNLAGPPGDDEQCHHQAQEPPESARHDSSAPMHSQTRQRGTA